MPSMSRKGNCWDNAVAESFFATLEKELLLDRPLTSTEQTRTEVIEYIEATTTRNAGIHPLTI